MKVVVKNKYDEGIDCVMPDFWEYLPTWHIDAGSFEVCSSICEIDDDPAIEKLTEVCGEYLALSEQHAELQRLCKQSSETLHGDFERETLKLSRRFRAIADTAMTGNLKVIV